MSPRNLAFEKRNFSCLRSQVPVSQPCRGGLSDVGKRGLARKISSGNKGPTSALIQKLTSHPDASCRAGTPRIYHVSLSTFEYTLRVFVLFPWPSFSVSYGTLFICSCDEFWSTQRSTLTSSHHSHSLAAPALQRSGGRPRWILLNRASVEVWVLKETKSQRS